MVYLMTFDFKFFFCFEIDMGGSNTLIMESKCMAWRMGQYCHIIKVFAD